MVSAGLWADTCACKYSFVMCGFFLKSATIQCITMRVHFRQTLSGSQKKQDCASAVSAAVPAVYFKSWFLVSVGCFACLPKNNCKE